MAVLKYATSGPEFQHDAKEYVVNMLSNARKLHKKNGCYYAKCFAKYYDFDTKEEALASGIEFTACKRCFKE